MNFLGLRSQSTAAQHLPPQVQAEPNNNRKPLEDLVAAEDPFPLASLVETFDGIVSENGAFSIADKHIDVCQEEGWITIPCKELPDHWNEEPDMLSFKSFDRPFVFPGEQVHILACLSAYKQDTEVITPFKVAELMTKNAKKQNGEVIHGSPLGSEVASSPVAQGSTDNANGKTPKKDMSTGESLLRMEDHRRQTEMLLQRFRNSHFFARIAEADEPLWSKRKTQETFRESTEMIGGKLSEYDDKKILPLDRENPDASSSGGVARNGFKCSSLANGDIVVLLQVNIGVDCLKDPVLEIIQFEKYEERSLSAEGSSLSYSNQQQGDPCGDLLKWLLPLENSLASPSRSLSPPQLSSGSSSIHSTSTRMNSLGSSSSPIFSFGHFRSYSMSSVPPSTMQPPVSPITSSRSTLLEDQDLLSNKVGRDEKGGGEGLVSFRGVPLEPERFSVRCGLQGIYIPGRRWRRKVEIIQPVEITSFTADCNTEDLLCVQIKNVSTAHMPDIVIYLDTITIIHEEASKGGPPLSLPIACIEAGSDHSLPDLALRRGEEHSFILKPATSLWWNNSKGLSPRLSSVHGVPSDGVMLGDKYAVLVSCRCNYTESRLFFKQPTSWRPRMPRDLLVSVASQMSRPTQGSDDRISQLPVQVLTLEASNLTSEDLTLTVLAPASFSCLPSVVSINSTPASPTDSDSRQDGNGPQSGSFSEFAISITDVLPTSDLGCTHLWLQSRVPLGCVPCRSTATIKLELLPLTDGIITLDSLQISVKEKGLTYVPEKSLRINATSSISSGII